MTPYDDLLNFVTASGVSHFEADYAVRRCLKAMAKQSLAGYTATGAIAYFLEMNPATALPYLIGVPVVAGGHALLNSPQCAEVRSAVSFWTHSVL